MQLNLTKEKLMLEIRDYIFISIGVLIYAGAWVAFLLPYEITTGGTTGLSAIVYYATGFPVQYTYFIINIFLILVAFKILGGKFTIKTTFAIFLLTGALEYFQWAVKDDVTGKLPQILGPGQDFMACLIGAAMCGIGLGIVFNNNGSTGGTDIIAAVINKYKDMSLGRLVMLSDVIIISSCYFVFHDWRRVIFGFVTLFIVGYALDYVVNKARSSVQFLIFSKKYDEIADRIIKETHRGVTVLDGIGWYSKNNVKVLVVLAYKRQSKQIFQLVKETDPNAFISQSSVIGVYGEGFDRLKIKSKSEKNKNE